MRRSIAGMRVALVCDWTAPRVGGIERQVHDLAVQLRARGHDARVVTFTPGPDAMEGIPVHRLRVPVPRGWRALQRALATVGFVLGDPLPRGVEREIERILVAERVDVVHAHSLWSSLGHMALHLGRRRGIPGVLTNHSLLDHAGILFFRAIDEVIPWSTWPAVITAVSAAAARDARWAARGREVRVIPNGIDAGAWPRASAGAPRVVSVLRLNRRKRPAALLRSLARVRGELDGGTPPLDVFGDGPQRQRLGVLARSLGVGDLVTFHGEQSPAGVAAALGDASVFALPGSREAFGIAAAEALAAGLPVIGMRGCGMEDVVRDGIDGLLADDQEAFGEHLLAVVRDAALRRRLAARAREGARRFDWAVVCESYLAAYRDATAVIPRPAVSLEPRV